MAYPERWIEFHDSQLLAVTTVGNRKLLFLRGYLHRPDPAGKPSGWIQAAVLILSDGNIKGETPEYPAEFWNGVLTVGGVAVEGIPVPFTTKDRVTLSLSPYGDWQSVEFAAMSSAAELLMVRNLHFVEFSER